jgi:phosphonoacetaldehyde methylase
MINTLTPELMDLMAQSGLYQITLSLDSGSAKTLKEFHHKPVNLNSIPGLIVKAKEYGIFTHGTLVVGMPGETLEDIEEGFSFVKNNLAFTSISVFIATAIPGSELYHQALEKNLIVKEDARRVNFTKSRIHLTSLDPAVLEARVKRFYEEFTETVKKRDPEEYYRKYSNLIKAKKNTHLIEASSEVTDVSVARLT